jgi:hypothetical protein
MRLLDRLVWQHLLTVPCQRDLGRCPERARQCAACPRRRHGSLKNRLATTLSSWRRRLRLWQILGERPALASYLALLILFLSAALGYVLALAVTR